MAWPISYNITTGVGKNGNLPALLAFGTEGLYSGVIVKNVRAIPLIEEIRIENGSGNTVTQILINDGDEYEITVIDDRAISWPQPGTPVSLLNPSPNGTNATVETYQVINNNYSVAAKAPGERSLLGKKYLLISPSQM